MTYFLVFENHRDAYSATKLLHNLEQLGLDYRCTNTTAEVKRLMTRQTAPNNRFDAFLIAGTPDDITELIGLIHGNPHYARTPIMVASTDGLFLETLRHRHQVEALAKAYLPGNDSPIWDMPQLTNHLYLYGVLDTDPLAA